MEKVDRQQIKEKIHPYRPYQLKIITLIILMCIFLYILLNLNARLNKEMQQTMNISTDLEIEDEKILETKQFLDIIEINYDKLYKLDKIANTDIISDYEQFMMIADFIATNILLKFEVVYKATKDGDQVNSFRQKCSGISPFVLLIETVEGFKFGVYSSIPIPKDNFIGYLKDDTSFIFSFFTKKKYKIIKGDRAISIFEGINPYFGEQDIYIGKNFLTSNSSYSKFPIAFEGDKNAPFNHVLSGGIKNFVIRELEFLNIYIG